MNRIDLLAKVSIVLYTINGGYFLSFSTFLNDRKVTRTVPVSIISLKELHEYCASGSAGLICLKENTIFYAPAPGEIDFNGQTFSLGRDDYNSQFTLATMDQVKTYTRTYPKISTSLEEKDGSSYALSVDTEFTEKAFVEIVREGNDNPGKPRRFVISEKITRVWNQNDLYPLREVSPKKLMEHRLSKVPGVVYKNGDKLFYSAIPGTLNLNSQAIKRIEKHACGNHCSMVCNGCPRTSAHTVASQQKFGKNFPAAVLDSWRIEKYPFVTEGIEAFNTNSSNDAFLVMECENYQTRTRSKTKRPSTELKLNLASYFWGDFDGDLREMRKRINQSNSTYM